MILFALALATDNVCISLGELSAGIIQAHEANVPIAKVMKLVNDPHVPPPARHIARRLVIEVYKDDRTGQPFDAVAFANTVAARCMEKQP